MYSCTSEGLGTCLHLHLSKGACNDPGCWAQVNRRCWHSTEARCPSSLPSQLWVAMETTAATQLCTGLFNTPDLACFSVCPPQNLPPRFPFLPGRWVAATGGAGGLLGGPGVSPSSSLQP